jgi:hypothetical protein
MDSTDKTTNQRPNLAAMAERDGRTLGAELQLGVGALLDVTNERAGEDPLPWHLGFLPCATMAGLLIGE